MDMMDKQAVIDLIDEVILYHLDLSKKSIHGEPVIRLMFRGQPIGEVEL